MAKSSRSSEYDECGSRLFAICSCAYPSAVPSHYTAESVDDIETERRGVVEVKEVA